jgi:biopolymer transport protein TolR
VNVNTNTDGSKYRIVAEINMIPFIDVALVLLIVFMVMTPFLIRAQIKVDLPDAGQAELGGDDKESLTVQVERSGDIFIEGQRVAAADVAAELRRRMAHPNTQPLYVEADKEVSFRHVVVVLDAGRQIGAARMSVCVKPQRAGQAHPLR